MTQAPPARRASRPRGRGRTVLPDPGGRYGLLLLLLVSTYLLSAFNGRTPTVDLQIGLFAAALLLALRTSPLPRPWPMLASSTALLGSAAALGASLTGSETGKGIADLWKGLLLLLTAVLIVRRVLARPTVTLQSIYGALSAYMIVGLMFAAFYSAIDHLGGAPFFAGGQPDSTQTFQYFSFTTLTTLGYGDFTAAGDGGRALAVIEALTGQIFLATLVARLVAAFRAPAEPGRPAAGRRWPPPRGRQNGAAATRRGRPPGDARRVTRPRA